MSKISKRGSASPEAEQAVADAERSRCRALDDKATAAAQRVIADGLADQIRQHNAANRYDDLLFRVMRGGEP